jgi:hypothetical protein
MGAPSKLWTAIVDGRIDANSPVVAKLLADIRDNLEHLEEWLGGSFVAQVDHNHDGANSAPVGNSEWQAFLLSDHFTALNSSLWTVAGGVTGAAGVLDQADVAYIRGQKYLLSNHSVNARTRSLRVAFSLCAKPWTDHGFSYPLQFGFCANVLNDAPNNDRAIVTRGTNANTLKFMTFAAAGGGQAPATTTDNIPAAALFNDGTAWNSLVIENWIDPGLALHGVKECVLFLNGAQVAAHRIDTPSAVPGQYLDAQVKLFVQGGGGLWVDYIRTTTPPTKVLAEFPLATI